MNYKHAFHAGNHTEVFKHSVLCLLLAHLRQKPKPFAVLDTHAGAGSYDLLSVESEKTGEARDGIARVIDKDVPAASLFLNLVRHLNPRGLRFYPGSPAIVQSFLGEDDRLIACELREDDAASLRTNFKNDSRTSVHCRDGYEAIGAFIPLVTRRGLVFIDPPFEQPEEFQRIADALNFGIKKWPTGILDLVKLDTGAANPALNRNVVHPLVVNWPSNERQAEIVQRIESIATEAKLLESLYERKLAEITDLKQSILQKAFSGELSLRPSQAVKEAAE
jgi:hypothetical protein